MSPDVSSRRRFLLLNQTFLPDPLATSQYLAAWVRHLAAKGNDVMVLASRRAYHDRRVRHPRREIWHGVRIVRVGGSRLGKTAKWRRAFDGLTFLLRAFCRGLFMERPDAIIALTSPPLLLGVAVLLARWHRARVVCWVMDLNPDAAIAAGWLKERSAIAQLLERLSRWSLACADRLIVLDAYMKEKLLAKGIADEKIDVIPLWMQARFDRAGREACRRRRGWEEKIVVMLAGNHGPCHSIQTLLDAAERLQDHARLHFCFMGGGVEWVRLRDLATRRRNLTLIDYVSEAELSATLSAADIQVAVMGNDYVGLIHPCKVYNILATQRAMIYIGPARGPIPDLIAVSRWGEAAASFRHGEAEALVMHLGNLARYGPAPLPASARTLAWEQAPLLEKMSSALVAAGR